MLSLHNDAIRKDNEPEPKAFTHISTPQKKPALRYPPSNETMLLQSPFMDID